jgi:hypothetical protein
MMTRQQKQKQKMVPNIKVLKENAKLITMTKAKGTYRSIPHLQSQSQAL